MPASNGQRTAAQTYVNLPVKDLQRSITFFTQLGFGFDPRFTDDKATCLILGENQFAMLLRHDFFQTFTPKTIVDAHAHVEALIALSLGSRQEVDELVAAAVAAGGKPDVARDHGFMYDHGFQDLDGHNWGVFWMDVPAFEKMRKEAKP
jgi:uncharacterized protein